MLDRIQLFLPALDLALVWKVPPAVDDLFDPALDLAKPSGIRVEGSFMTSRL